MASAKQLVEDVPLPSGAVFKMRLAPIKQWVATGVLPASLAAKMQTAAQSGNTEEVAKKVLASFTEEDFVAQQNLAKRLLEHCCVEPKVSVAADDPDALQPEDIDPDDFEFLMKWIWSGGKSGESLGMFPEQRQQPAVAGSGGA